MDIINNILDNKIQIQIDDRIIDVNDIEKVERKLFLFKEFRLNIKLKTGEVIQKNYKSLDEMYKNYEKFITEAGFDFSGKLRKERFKYINGNIYLKKLIIIANELTGIRWIEEAKKKLKSVLHQGESYDIKIELFLKGGNTVILEMENEQYAEYDFEQLKRIFELKKLQQNKIRTKLIVMFTLWLVFVIIRKINNRNKRNLFDKSV